MYFDSLGTWVGPIYTRIIKFSVLLQIDHVQILMQYLELL